MLVAADSKRHGPEPCRHKVTFEVGFHTHIGFGRQASEDAYGLAPDAFYRGGRPAHLMAAVADGMGGHKGGGIASRFACNALKDFYRDLAQSNGKVSLEQVCRELIDSIFRIDRRLRFKGCRIEGMQEMVTEGEIDPAEAGSHPLRHLLTQVVGTPEPLEHVLARVDRLKAGDRFLLCTDGVHNWVPDEQISDGLALGGDAGLLASYLVDTALINKARDNVTALVITVQDPGG